eukprot:3566510-Pyramimonas_sp.AAC.1
MSAFAEWGLQGWPRRPSSRRAQSRQPRGRSPRATRCLTRAIQNFAAPVGPAANGQQSIQRLSLKTNA